MTVLGYPVAWWLIDAAAALAAGFVFTLLHWCLVQESRWKPERFAYQQRLVERERRRPFDEAWAAWIREVQERVRAQLLLDAFERRIADLQERSERSWELFMAADDSSLEAVR
jgi:hypothetical protein